MDADPRRHYIDAMHIRVAAVAAFVLVGSCSSSSPAPAPNESAGPHGSCVACAALGSGALPLAVTVVGGNVHDGAIEAIERLFKDKGFVVKTNPGKTKKNPLRPGLACWPDVILYAASESEPVGIIEVETEEIGERERGQWREYAGHGVPLHVAVPEGHAATRASYWVRETGLAARVWPYREAN